MHFETGHPLLEKFHIFLVVQYLFRIESTFCLQKKLRAKTFFPSCYTFEPAKIGKKVERKRLPIKTRRYYFVRVILAINGQKTISLAGETLTAQYTDLLLGTVLRSSLGCKVRLQIKFLHGFSVSWH